MGTHTCDRAQVKASGWCAARQPPRRRFRHREPRPKRAGGRAGGGDVSDSPGTLGASLDRAGDGSRRGAVGAFPPDSRQPIQSKQKRPRAHRRRLCLERVTGAVEAPLAPLLPIPGSHPESDLGWVPAHGTHPNSERVTGIEPALSAWKAEALPLSYTRGTSSSVAIRRLQAALAARTLVHRRGVA